MIDNQTYGSRSDSRDSLFRCSYLLDGCDSWFRLHGYIDGGTLKKDRRLAENKFAII
jgi:hypothetical protein